MADILVLGGGVEYTHIRTEQRTHTHTKKEKNSHTVTYTSYKSVAFLYPVINCSQNISLTNSYPQHIVSIFTIIQHIDLVYFVCFYVNHFANLLERVRYVFLCCLSFFCLRLLLCPLISLVCLPVYHQPYP